MKGSHWSWVVVALALTGCDPSTPTGVDSVLAPAAARQAPDLQSTTIVRTAGGARLTVPIDGVTHRLDLATSATRQHARLAGPDGGWVALDRELRDGVVTRLTLSSRDERLTMSSRVAGSGVLDVFEHSVAGRFEIPDDGTDWHEAYRAWWPVGSELHGARASHLVDLVNSESLGDRILDDARSRGWDGQERMLDYLCGAAVFCATRACWFGPNPACMSCAGAAAVFCSLAIWQHFS